MIIDVALVAAALGTNRAPHTNASTVTSVATPSARPTVAAPAATPKTVATISPTIRIAPPTRLMTALNSSTLWRTEVGSCPGGEVTPELSTDGGETWETAADSGSAAILALTTLSNTEASMVTLSAIDCAPELVATFVAGDQWATYPDRLANNWYVNPTDRAVVHSPAGSFPAPCSSVIALAPRSDTVAAVLCSDGTLVRTADSGASWGAAVATPGAVNINTGSDGYILAAAGWPACGGVQLLTTPEALDGATTPIGCHAGAFSEGAVALAETNGRVILWAGDSQSWSADGGATWQ